MSKNLNIIFQVKSRYIIKKIFSNLNDRRKALVTLYNQKINDILNIDLDFIKKVSGIFKEAPINGKGKEYILGTNIKIYEGGYKNKKRSGKGKEYDKYGYLKYEGEYLNGKKSGFGTEYYDNDIIFKGEYLEGKKHGKGTEYYGNYQYKFDGIYKNGKKWDGIGYNDMGKEEYILKDGTGKVKEYNDFGKLIFEGEYLNGEENGKGKEYSEINGKLEFDGEYLNGKKWIGNIIKYNDGGKRIFEGFYVDGNINGKVKEWNNDEMLIFNGEYLNGKRWDSKKEKIQTFHSSNHNIEIYGEYIKGIEIRYVYLDKTLILQCEYINGTKNGEGKEYYNDGKLKFDGLFKKGKKWEGKGFTEKGNEDYIITKGSGKVKEYHYNNNLMLEGEYLNGEKNGKIREYYDNGKLRLEGEYLNGEKNGKFKDYFDNGKLRLEEEYLNGEKNGKCKQYNDSGVMIFEGDYKNGKKNGKIKEYNYKGGLTFEGEYLNGKKNGIVKQFAYDSLELIFEGEYINDKKK